MFGVGWLGGWGGEYSLKINKSDKHINTLSTLCSHSTTACIYNRTLQTRSISVQHYLHYLPTNEAVISTPVPLSATSSDLFIVCAINLNCACSGVLKNAKNNCEAYTVCHGLQYYQFKITSMYIIICILNSLFAVRELSPWNK